MSTCYDLSRHHQNTAELVITMPNTESVLHFPAAQNLVSQVDQPCLSTVVATRAQRFPHTGTEDSFLGIWSMLAVHQSTWPFPVGSRSRIGTSALPWYGHLSAESLNARIQSTLTEASRSCRSHPVARHILPGGEPYEQLLRRVLWGNSARETSLPYELCMCCILQNESNINKSGNILFPPDLDRLFRRCGCCCGGLHSMLGVLTVEEWGIVGCGSRVGC